MCIRDRLMQDGVLCPSDPFWYEEFLPYKYKELFLALPDLGGIVCSIGTGEARLAISNTFACGCERCRHLDPVEWYKNMIMAMYKPFHEAGKKLIIRDFIYTKEEQERFKTAFNAMPEDIVLLSLIHIYKIYHEIPPVIKFVTVETKLLLKIMLRVKKATNDTFRNQVIMISEDLSRAVPVFNQTAMVEYVYRVTKRSQ